MKSAAGNRLPPANQPVRTPAAPPVYRPQPVPHVLQRKTAGATPPQPGTPQPARHPVAPPAYRPQPVPKVLQAKKESGAKAAPARAADKSPAAPPAPQAQAAQRPPLQGPARQGATQHAAGAQPARRGPNVISPKMNARPNVIQRNGEMEDLAYGALLFLAYQNQDQIIRAGTNVVSNVARRVERLTRSVGFWELDPNGGHTWRGNAPNLGTHAATGTEHRGSWRQYSYPVYRRIGFWELTEHGGHAWHDGAAGMNTHVATGTQRNGYDEYTKIGFWEVSPLGVYAWHDGAVDLNTYQVTGNQRNGYTEYTRIGFWERTAVGVHAWHDGAPNPNIHVRTGNHRGAQNAFNYDEYIEVTALDFRNWLTAHGMTVANGAPGNHVQTGDGQDGTYRFWWFNSVVIKGHTMGLGANIHYDTRYYPPHRRNQSSHGKLGSVWIQGGPQNLSVNAQNNPIRVALTQRLKDLATQHYGANFP